MIVLDWLGREGWIVLSWWALATLAGAAALPLCFRLLRGLPDWGYTLSRAAGLLLVGFIYWLLASLGFLRNSNGSIVLAWLIALGLSLLVYLRGERLDLRAWWRENKRVVLVVEILFAVLLFGWAFYRAHQNGLTGTEKPMELMMMNSIARSDIFPPNDGWMAGYAISYYYFGYVMSAMLSMLTSIPGMIGFNMTIALLFALTGITAFGVGYNLVRARALRETASPSVALVAGALALIFVVLLGNFQLPLLEMPYQTGTASESYLRFWGVDEREVPSISTKSLDPAEWGHWWWFRASRVLNDLDLNNRHMEVIDEFPSFSFLLADVHPHVLALPFVMLAMGLALNILLTNHDPTWLQTTFYGLTIGGLAFLNTWDAPIYLALMVGAEALRRMIRSGRGRVADHEWTRLFVFGGILVGLMIALYLPFWLGFRSQAGGILPNLLNPTRTQQLFMMFGPFVLLLPPFLIAEAWRAGRRMNWLLGLLAGFGILVLLIAAMLLLAYLGWQVPALRGEAVRLIEEAGGMQVVLPLLLNRRVETILTPLLLVAGVALVIGRLFPRLLPGKPYDDEAADYEARQAVTYPPSTGFALLLAGAGLLLILAPEYIYLRDNFGSRMNTVFKFYYQAWLLLSIASAYAVYSLLADVRAGFAPVLRAAYGALAALVVTLGLLYPAMGVYTRALVENGRMFASSPQPLTLNGGRTFVTLDDYESIMCLNGMIDGDEAVVVEAIGPAYRSEYGRVAALTGIPILLGWENHENQWRGPTYPQITGTRPADIRTLYQDPRWETAQQIIDRYGIDYIFYGQSERDSYGVGGEDKFRDQLEIVCERGASRFYRVKPATEVAAG